MKVMATKRSGRSDSEADLKREFNRQSRKLNRDNDNRVKHYDHVPRTDGWVNVLTGQGIQGYDKRTGGYASYGTTLYEMDVEYLYGSDAHAARIVDLIPDEATREGFEWDEPQPEIDAEFDRLQVKPKFNEAWKFARAYGGAGTFINDGTPPDKLYTPLNLNNVNRIISLTNFTRWELYILFEDIDRDLTSPTFMKPLFYRLQPRIVLPAEVKTSGGSPIFARIHHTRIIRWDGKNLLRLLNIRNQYWSDSIYTAMLNELRDFGVSFGAVGGLVQDFRVFIHKIAGLANMLTMPDGQANLKKRIEAMQMARSMLGTYVCDKESEDVTVQGSPVTGLPEILDRIMIRLGAACDIPHTILFNQSPSGLGASGNSEITNWYNHIHSIQVNYFSPKLDRAKEVICAQKLGPTKGKQIPNKYAYKPLSQPTAKEQAETEKLKSETYGNYHNLGAIDPEEIINREFPETVRNNALNSGGSKKPGQSAETLGQKVNIPEGGTA